MGCDASATMVELARARTQGGVEVHVQNLDEPLSWLPDDAVDLVLSALAYHYLNDRPAFLREARRVLAPGGSIVISTHHPISDWLRLGGSYFEESHYSETWSKGWEVAAWRLPLTQLCAEFTEAGLVIERLVEPLPLPAMETHFHGAWSKLTREPAFIIFRLRPSQTGTQT